MTDATLRSMMLSIFLLCPAAAQPRVEIEQITHGPRHHFFGYIGQCRTIPWNQSGRYIVALQTEFQDHMPTPADKAEIILIDTHNDDRIRVVDHTRAWNPQQGTMLYWNPEAPETQFVFNDRDPSTNKVFAVLFDISAGENGRRIREYRFDDTPVGNSGVAQNGGTFLGINYARLARLRSVTGYPGTWDWNPEAKHPDNDGIFRIDVAAGRKELIVSFQQLRDVLRPTHPHVDDVALFINHTLWSRDGKRIYFYARGGWSLPGKDRINVPFTVRPDGSQLTMQKVFIGGHPEWADGPRMIGAVNDRQVIYDTDRQQVVATLGNAEIFPSPGGDIALSPDGRWLVNGYRSGRGNRYVFYRMADGAFVRSEAVDQHGYINGDLRSDPAPCWNRESNEVLFASPSDDADHTRQLFRIRLRD